MGTDIHLYIEKRDADGNWSRAFPAPWTCPWCDGGKTNRDGSDCYWCKGAGLTSREYDERNYDLFAMLAGVRNGVAFAGCDTGDGFVPLAEPRGIPSDTSIQSDDDYDGDGHVDLGDHSFSHCTLAEILAYDYDRTTLHRGVVSAKEYAAWSEAGGGGPKSYSGDVWGQNVKHVSNAKMGALIASGEATDNHYTRVEWPSTYRESAGKAWFNFLEACRGIGDPESVRFVFGFDS